MLVVHIVVCTPSMTAPSAAVVVNCRLTAKPGRLRSTHDA
jgi:hypothetical protein